MPDINRCAECETPLPAYWPKGLCAQCALDGALEMTNAASQVFQAESPSAPTNLHSPSSAENSPLGSFGDYDLLEEIARGGMGVVYKARQRNLDRIVAVKMILAGPLAGKEFVQRFRTESAAAAILQHPNIVAIHDVGVHEGRHYFSMDYVEGENLAQRVGQQPLPPAKAVQYVEIIAEAIHYAHERGILHRDLKPSNVLIDSNDQPRITDFGLARRLDGESSLTMTGQVLGSPNFMPPEQAGGTGGKVGRPSDVYALGGILYYLLTARAPFQADSLEHTITQVLNAEPVSPRLLNPSIPRDLETITLKCLEKEPSRRYQTAKEMADELGRVLRQEPIQARPVSRTEKLWRWCRRKPALAGSLAAVVVLLTVVAIGSPIAVVRVRREQQKVAVQARELGLNLYAADIYLAQNAIRDGNYGLAQRALQAHFPKQGERDLRGFEWCFFWRLLQGDKWAAWHAHSYVVSSIAVSPNAKWIASGGADHQIKLWDAASHRLLKMFPKADCTAFSADGNLLLTASEEGLVQVFDVETRERKSAFMTGRQIQEKPVAYLAASPTEPILAVCTDGSLFGRRGSVRLYNYLTSEEIGTLTNSGNRMAFSRDGRILVTGSSGNQIKVWNVATRKQLKAFGHVGGISSLALSPDGQLLATTEFWSGDIRLWDVVQGVELSPLRGHTVMTWQVAFSPDGKRLASGSSDQTIRIWDVEGRTQVRTLIGHASEVWAVAFSPDGRYLVSGSKDETVAVWPPGLPSKDDTIKVANTVRNPPIFSPDGRVLAAAGGGGEVAGELVLWNVASATVQAVLPGERAGLWFSPDAQTLLTLGTNNSELHFWDLPRRVIRETISLAPQIASVRGAVASTDGERVAAASDDGPTIALWERRSGVRKVNGQIQSVNCLEFSLDHRLLAVCGEALAEVWDVEAGTVLWTLRGHKSEVSAIAFSADGDTLASCSVDNTAKLWSLSRRRELATLEGHREGVKWVAFTPDGKTLATACADGSLKLWHVPTGREIASIKRLSRAWFTRFSPDGKSLAYAAGWGSLILLRCPSRAEIDFQRRGEGTLSDGGGIDKTIGTTVSLP